MSRHEPAVEPIADVSSLELSGERMRALVDATMERLVVFIETLSQQPSYDDEGAAEMARSLIEPLPERGRPYQELLELLFEKVIPKGFGTGTPGYLGYIPGGGIFHSAVADLIADSVNRFTSIWLPAPGLAQIEAVVVRWLCEIVGYPRQAGGILTTGGSMANFSALVTARRERLPEDFLAGTIYVSDQVHHSLQKSAMLAGFPAANVREIPSDEQYRLRMDLLESKIIEDRDAGFTPFFIVANAGTVNTGAVDDLEGVADVAERQGLWLHMDAAYGGFFLLTERGRKVLAGIGRADSIVLDPHKGMFLPYGTGSLLVRDGTALERAHAVDAGYLPTMQQDPDFVDFSEISPELSRDHRGLRLWLPVKMHGIEAFRRNLDEKLDLARWATGELRKIDGIEIVAEPQLSLVAFRLVRPGLDAEQLNRLNRALIDGINLRKRVFLSGTVLDGSFLLRICVLSFRTHMDRMREGLEDIRAAVAAVAG
ncbi:MAG: pyridoxal phosphate-dependent decarboxylase family protein [Acidobacteriota bacterium]